MDEIRVDEHGIMLRPRRRDDCVRRRAAEMALPQFKRWMGPGYSDARLIKILMKHIDGPNGLEIANSLQHDGYGSDFQLASLFEENFIGEAEVELVKQWVKCLGVKLDLPIGTPAEYRGEQGTVARHDSDLAQYGIQVPSQADGTHLIVNAEDTRPVQAILQESAA